MIVSEPEAEKKAATLAASPLDQAAVYCAAKSLNLLGAMFVVPIIIDPRWGMPSKNLHREGEGCFVVSLGGWPTGRERDQASGTLLIHRECGSYGTAIGSRDYGIIDDAGALVGTNLYFNHTTELPSKTIEALPMSGKIPCRP